MNMKKLMAAILAVVIAISAMAISAFAAEAETYKIDLYNYGNVGENVVTWTFDVPVYNLHGYATYDNYLKLDLPTKFTKTGDFDTVAINYYIEVNGVRTQLKGVKADDAAAAEYGVFTQYVNFGALTHPYIDNNGTDIWATIAQSGMVNDITSLKVIAEIKYAQNAWEDITMPVSVNPWESNQNFKTNYDGDANTEPNVLHFVEMWTAGDDGIKTYDDNDTVVTGSTTYAYNMNVAKSAGANWWTPKLENFAGTEVENGTPKGGLDLTWDHNIQNKAAILNAESAKVVVELDGTTNGVALYTLYTMNQDPNNDMWGNGSGDLWWDYIQDAWNQNHSKEIASTCIINGSTNTLEFDVPLEYLYNANYGVYNGLMKITERQTLNAFETVNGQPYYNGAKINYVKNATEIYLLLTMPAVDDGEDNIDVENPIEPGDTPTEDEEPGDIEVEEPTPEEPEDTNPDTGIVLAVLPMAIAAAAVVVSKRR